MPYPERFLGVRTHFYKKGPHSFSLAPYLRTPNTRLPTVRWGIRSAASAVSDRAQYSAPFVGSTPITATCKAHRADVRSSSLTGEAPYPASVTARITSSGEAFPSTPIVFVRRLTEHESTPATLDTAFSTLAWHAAQLIPVTIYCSILLIWPSRSTSSFSEEWQRALQRPHHCRLLYRF